MSINTMVIMEFKSVSLWFYTAAYTVEKWPSLRCLLTIAEDQTGDNLFNPTAVLPASSTFFSLEGTQRFADLLLFTQVVRHTVYKRQRLSSYTIGI